MNIIIVGGGFGGVKAALELSKQKKNRITLISSSNHFQYYPAIYSTATGHSYKETWTPLTNIFENRPVTLVRDTITSVDPDTKSITGTDGTRYSYDKLILALGSVTTFFGIEGLDEYAYGIKSEAEVRKLQKHLYDEMSDGSDDEKNYVIIGAGPTGVELAGALGEYLKVLRTHFNARDNGAKISLIEAAPRVLPRMSEKASQMAEARLKKLGINVETNKKVEKGTATGLVVNGKRLQSQTIIWTSGVANPSFYKENQHAFILNDRGKVVVDEFMRASRHIYVIGDNAATPYAGLAQTALHDAHFITGHLKGSKKKYKAVLPPSVIPIGYGWALFEWNNLRFAGWPGSFMRMCADLIGYHDILPIGTALGAWRASTKAEMVIPENVDLT